MTWVLFIKNKSETYAKFKEFKSREEKQRGSYLKVLRYGEWWEYDSKDFATYCREQGSQRHFKTKYNSQQNGILERKNTPSWTWQEKSQKFTKWILGVYLGQISKQSVKNKVSLESRSGIKTSISHLTIFGFVSYAHVPKQIRRKLDDKSEKCIFLGYSEQSKAYKLCNLVTKKTIIIRDVKFLEYQAWNNDVDGTTGSEPFPHAFEHIEAIWDQDSTHRLSWLQVQGEASRQ